MIHFKSLNILLFTTAIVQTCHPHSNHAVQYGGIRSSFVGFRKYTEYTTSYEGNRKHKNDGSRLKWIREKTVFYSFLCKILIASNKINRTNIYPYTSKYTLKTIKDKRQTEN